MRFRKNRKIYYTAIAAVLFVAIVAMAGLAYANANFPATPKPAWAAGPHAAATNAHIDTSSSVGGGDGGVGLSHMQNDTSGKQAQLVQDFLGQFAVSSAVVEGMHTLPDDADQLAQDFAQINEATEELFAAADDLANAMTVSVAAKFNRSEKENIALLLDEGRKFEFLPIPQGTYSENSKGSFSLISKALAQGGGSNDNGPYVFVKGPGDGHPGNCKDQSDDYGASIQSSSNDEVDKRTASADEYHCTLGYVVPGAPRSPLGNNPFDAASSASDTMKVGYMGRQSTNGGATKACFREVVMNCAMGSGGGASGDNSDHSSFFISSAYAQGGGGPVTKMAGNFLGKSQKWCTLANKRNIGVAQCKKHGGTISPREAGCAIYNSDATNLNKAIGDAPLVHAADIHKNISDGAKHSAFCQYGGSGDHAGQGF